MNVLLITCGTLLALYAALTLLELAVPAEAGHGVAGRFRNVVTTAAYLALGTSSLDAIGHLVPLGPRTTLEPGPLPDMLVVLVFVFAFDLVYYWYHRAQHRYRFLWAIHEVHHSDAELNVTTSYRTHWLELPVQALVIATPLHWVLGDPSSAFLLTFNTLLGWELFTHLNVRLDLSFLSPIVCGPQVHRIHHSILDEHQGKNFAQYFPVIDIVFGTYHSPARGEFPPTGSKGLATTASVWTILTHPFRQWSSLLLGDGCGDVRTRARGRERDPR